MTIALLQYIHMPYASVFEVMFILQFKNGLGCGQKPVNPPPLNNQAVG
jgi:hypothetical protein